MLDDKIATSPFPFYTFTIYMLLPAHTCKISYQGAIETELQFILRIMCTLCESGADTWFSKVEETLNYNTMICHHSFIRLNLELFQKKKWTHHSNRTTTSNVFTTIRPTFTSRIVFRFPVKLNAIFAKSISCTYVMILPGSYNSSPIVCFLFCFSVPIFFISHVDNYSSPLTFDKSTTYYWLYATHTMWIFRRANFRNTTNFFLCKNVMQIVMFIAVLFRTQIP